MLLRVDIEDKTMGAKRLFANLKFTVGAAEKIAIIGRNGVGKTTLFNMINGSDKDYAGSINLQRGLRVVSTAQEHHDLGQQTVMAYIIHNLPEYAQLKHVIDTYPETMGENMRQIETYSEALERFGQLDYYNVEDRIRQSLEAYQIGGASNQPMARLSGGQKRFVELIRIEHSAADLALIDEPTNHMDYAAKASFLQWFAAAKCAVVVITHDRDVLAQVSRIIEIKDQAAELFPGNYAAYLRQNAERTTNQLNEYDTVQRRIANLKKQIASARAKKAGSSKSPNPFVVIENRLVRELQKMELNERPSFWIDQESAGNLRPNVEASYQKHKSQTIRIRRFTAAERPRQLLRLDKVQVGYDRPLFAPLTLSISSGDRRHIIGRNGAGKTTLVRTIIQSVNNQPATLLAGTIETDLKLRINTYEQELSDQLLDQTLGAAIEQIYRDFHLPISDEQIMRVLSDYLFDPYADRQQPLRNLSGGQKARLQLIKMFAGDPNLLILDEPTNHLDLPSIEELENALAQYRGALIYVSHDSYLATHLAGEPIHLSPLLELANLNY